MCVIVQQRERIDPTTRKNSLNSCGVLVQRSYVELLHVEGGAWERGYLCSFLGGG